MTKIDPLRILVACQGPAREPFTSETERLFKSLNIWGGKLAKSQKIAFFTEHVDIDLKNSLERLGVKVRIIENNQNKFVHTNKIQILKFVQEENFDLLISLDTDIVIAGDFSDVIDGSGIGAKPDDIDPLDSKMWKNIFNHFGVTFPAEKCQTTFTMTNTIPYFNSGVLLIPQPYVGKLYDLWQLFISKLVQEYTNLAEISKNSFYTDQIALSLALSEGKFPFYALPLSMNFPTHIGSHKYNKPDISKPFLEKYREDVSKTKPFLIHYHHRVTKRGNIRHCYYDDINDEIDKINISTNVDNTNLTVSSNKKSDKSEDYEILVDNLYLECLRRSADKGGLQHFTELLDSKKMTVSDVRKALLNSVEYQTLKISDENKMEHNRINSDKFNQLTIQEDTKTVVDEIYVEILRRPADIQGLEYYSSLLENGKLTISDVRKALLNSEEYAALKTSDEIAFGHTNIDTKQLKRIISHHDNYDMLLKIVNMSRNNFGWFTRHLPRVYEYTWIVQQLHDIRGKTMLDIGTGISPIPLFLAREGAKIVTVDHHNVIRKLDEDRNLWNEWGFFDYSVLDKSIQSFNSGIESLTFPNNYFDIVYSISTIEHIPANIRRQIWVNANSWMKRGSQLVLTVDLIRGTKHLWNYDEEQVIEDVTSHGSLQDLISEITHLGFELAKNELLQDLPSNYKVDCALLLFQKL